MVSKETNIKATEQEVDANVSKYSTAYCLNKDTLKQYYERNKQQLITKQMTRNKLKLKDPEYFERNKQYMKQYMRKYYNDKIKPVRQQNSKRQYYTDEEKKEALKQYKREYMKHYRQKKKEQQETNSESSQNTSPKRKKPKENNQ